MVIFVFYTVFFSCLYDSCSGILSLLGSLHSVVLQDEANFRHLEMNVDLEIQTSEKLLRTAQLEEVLTEGEKSQSITEGSDVYKNC